MSLRCPCFQEEFAGADHTIVCRQYIARHLKWSCPRRNNKWHPRDLCRRLEKLIRNENGSSCTLEQATKILFPVNPVEGIGEPAKPAPPASPVEQAIKEFEGR